MRIAQRRFQKNVLVPLAFFLFIAPGCVRNRGYVAPFREVIAAYEKQINEARDHLLRDSTNTQLLAKYADAVLQKRKFDIGVVLRAYWRSSLETPSMADVQRRLESAVGRDSTSWRLFELLGNVFMDPLRNAYWYLPKRGELRRRLAIKAFRSVISLDSTRVDARLELARLMFGRVTYELPDSSQIAASREIILDVVKKEPENGKAWYYLGLSYGSSGFLSWGTVTTSEKVDKSLRCVTNAQRYGVDNVEFYLVLAGRYKTLGETDLFNNSAFMKRVREIPRPVLGYGLLPTVFLLGRSFGPKPFLVEKALRLNPYCLEALSISLNSSNDPDEVRELYRRLDEVDSTYEILPESPSLLKSFTELVDREPNAYRATMCLSLIYRKAKDTTRAIQLMEKAAAIRPNLPFAFASLSDLYRSKGWYEKADTVLEIASRIDPAYYSSYLHLAPRFTGQKAVAMYEKVLQAPFSSAWQAYDMRQVADTLSKIGLAQRAQTVRRMLIDSLRSTNPWYLDDFSAHTLIAEAFENLKEYGKAIGMYQQVLNEDPEYRFYCLREIARLQSVDGKYANAILVLERVLREEKLSVELQSQIYLEIGNNYLLVKNLAAAEKVFEKAVGMHPAGAAVWKDVGKIYEERGYKAKALGAYKRASRTGF